MLPTTPRSRPLYGSITLLLAALATSVAVPSADAASYIWDGNSGTAGAQDGSGTWDTVTNNWINAGSNAIWADNNDATFGSGVDGTYLIDVALSPAATSLKFNASGYTLNASSARVITLSNAADTLSVAAGKIATIGSNVKVTTKAANSNYVISGGGTLIIESGGEVNNGATQNSNVLSINATTVEVRTGGILSTSPTTSGVPNAIFVNGTVNVTGGALNAGGTLGIGQSTGTTAGTLTLASGTVNATSDNGIRFGGNSGTTAGGTVNLDGGILKANIIQKGIGTEVTTAVFNFNGGTLQANASKTNFMVNLGHAYVRDGGAIIDTAGNNITIGQNLEHSVVLTDNAIDGGLTKRGAGTLTLTGENTYSGPTVITGGSLKLANSKALGSSTIDSGNSAIQVQLGNSVTITNSIRLFGAGPANDGVLKSADGINRLTDFGVSGGGGTRINVAAGSTLELPNSIVLGTNGSAQNFRVIAPGTLVLGGDNSALLGFNQTFLLGSGTGAGPTVQVGNDLALGFATIDFQPVANSTIASSDTTAHTFANNLRFSDTASNLATFGSAGTGDLTFTGSATLLGNTEIAVQNSKTTLSGGISGLASLTKSGPGTLVLNGFDLNTFEGGTSVNSGVLQVEKAGGLGTGNVSVASGATLKLELDLAGNDYISDSGRLLLAAGTPLVQLDFTGTPDTIAALSFDGGTTFVTPGIWGSPTSGAQFTSPLFSGAGTLNVLAVPEPNTAALFVACTALLGLRRRRTNSR